MLKRITILSLMLGLLSTGLLAAEKDYTPAKKPGLTLKKADLSVIDKATKKNFKGLSTKEKTLLLKYLKDYANSAKHEKGVGKKMKPGTGKKIKPVNPVKPNKSKAIKNSPK